VLKKIGEEYKAVLAKIDGVTDIEFDLQPGKDEIRLTVNESLAAQAGLSVTQVAAAVNTAFDGNVATKIKRLTEEVDVRVRFADQFRHSPGMLDLIQVQNMQGYLVPVSRMAGFERGQGVVALNHLDGNRLLTVSAGVNEKKTNSRQANLKAAVMAKDIIAKYPGYGVQFGGENKDTEESMASLGRAFAVGLIIIFLILASLFRSLIQPVIVVAAIPFSLIGVVLAFLSHGHPFSFLAMMGVIGLAGVVVNDSIVLVDFANKIRDENPEMHIDQVVLDAGALRLRAVLLTTITTVLGLLPTAYGIGGKDPFLVPMALAFAWGLAFATFLTLIVVPILYKSEYQFKHWLSQKLGFPIRRAH
ncbi:MAG: efflux RND transporter permease subunit, partial [Nitrospirae bacterium]|nr:efflux RND transporter permease subunit [Fimbriimonadaceae bacterium]